MAGLDAVALDAVNGGIRQGELGNCYLCATMNGIERVSPGYLEGRLSGTPDLVTTQFADGRVVFMEQPALDPAGRSPVHSTGTPAELATEKAWALALNAPGESVVVDPALRAAPDPYRAMFESVMGRPTGDANPGARLAYGTDAGGHASDAMRQLGLEGIEHRLPGLDHTAVDLAQRPNTVVTVGSVPNPPADTRGDHYYTVGNPLEGRVPIENPHGSGNLLLTPSEVGTRFNDLEAGRIPRGGPTGPDITPQHLETFARNLPFNDPRAELIRANIDPSPVAPEILTREALPGGPGRAAAPEVPGDVSPHGPRLAGTLVAAVPIGTTALTAADDAYRRDTGEGFLNPTVRTGLDTFNSGVQEAGHLFPVSSTIAQPVSQAVRDWWGEPAKDASPAERATDTFFRNAAADTAGFVVSAPAAAVDLAILPFTAPIHAARLLGTPEPLTAATQNAAFRRDMDLAATTYKDLVAAAPPTTPEQAKAYQDAALSYARDPFVQQSLYDAERFLGQARGTGTADDVNLANQLVRQYGAPNDSADAEIQAARVQAGLPAVDAPDPFAGPAQVVNYGNTATTGDFLNGAGTPDPFAGPAQVVNYDNTVTTGDLYGGATNPFDDPTGATAEHEAALYQMNQGQMNQAQTEAYDQELQANLNEAANTIAASEDPSGANGEVEAAAYQADAGAYQADAGGGGGDEQAY